MRCYIYHITLYESFAHQPLIGLNRVWSHGRPWMSLTKSFEPLGWSSWHAFLLYLGRSRYQQTCRRGYGITEQIWYRGLLHRKGGVTLAHAHSYELWIFPKTSVLLSIWFANHLFDKKAEHENKCVRHNTNTSRIVSSLVSLIISYQHKPKAIMLRLLSALTLIVTASHSAAFVPAPINQHSTKYFASADDDAQVPRGLG